MGEVNADRIAFGDSNIPYFLLVIWVDLWEVWGCDPPIHFLWHNAAPYSAIEHSQQDKQPVSKGQRLTEKE